MMGKLMKYDLKSMMRTFIPLWLLCPFVAFLFTFSLKGMIGRTETVFEESGMGFLARGNTIMTIVLTIVFFCVMMAMAVMTVLFVVQRFWNGLLKEEGYLMFTLPVDTWELVMAKGVCATIVTFLSFLVGMISFFIMAFGVVDFSMSEIGFLWDHITWESSSSLWEAFATIVAYLLLMILSIAQSIYQTYAAMALGQLFPSHRVLGAVVSYIGLSVVLSIIVSMSTMGTPFLEQWCTGELRDVLGMLLPYLWVTVQIVLFHIITERILSLRLNLE